MKNSRRCGSNDDEMHLVEVRNPGYLRSGGFCRKLLRVVCLTFAIAGCAAKTAARIDLPAFKDTLDKNANEIDFHKHNNSFRLGAN